MPEPKGVEQVPPAPWSVEQTAMYIGDSTEQSHGTQILDANGDPVAWWGDEAWDRACWGDRMDAVAAFIAQAPTTIATLTATLTAKDAEIEALRALGDLQAEYVKFLGEANEGPIGLAAGHGWRCDPEDFARGEDYRARIARLTPTESEGGDVSDKLNFKSLSHRQLDALCSVAFGGNGYGFAPRTLESLERKGLIEPVEITATVMGAMSFTHKRWEMPISVHLDFCEFCEAQIADTSAQGEPKRPYPWCQRQTCDGLGTCPQDPTCGD
jgi:hypothetical protein